MVKVLTYDLQVLSSLNLFVVCCHCSEAQPILCLVYVDRIIKAKAIERVLKKMTYLSHLSASHLTGNNGSVNALTTKLEEDALESFCSGKVYLPHYFICQHLKSYFVLKLILFSKLSEKMFCSQRIFFLAYPKLD